MTAPHAVLKKFPPLGEPESPGLPAVEIRDLSEHFGAVAAVNHLSFDIEPGRVTGFLGRPGRGIATAGGRPRRRAVGGERPGSVRSPRRMRFGILTAPGRAC